MPHRSALWGFIFLFSILAGPQARAQTFNLGKTMSPTAVSYGQTVTICFDLSGSSAVTGLADIVWVIDISTSMSTGIANIIANINSFTTQLSSSNIGYRNGLVTFTGSGPTTPNISSYGFAANDAQFSGWLSSIALTGGYEPVLEALLAANNFAWRPGASKTLVLVTDEAIDCQEMGSSSLSMQTTLDQLYAQGVVVHGVTVDSVSTIRCNGKDLPPLAGGVWLSYTSPPATWQAFMSTLGNQVTTHTNTIVEDVLPPGLAPIPGSGASMSITGNTVYLGIPVLQLTGGSVTVQECFEAEVVDTQPGSLINSGASTVAGMAVTAAPVTIWNFGTGPTYTPTPFVPGSGCGQFLVDQNLFQPSVRPVSIEVEVCDFPGDFQLEVFNSAGEQVRTLDRRRLTAHYEASYAWDGKNEYGDPCAAGVYLLVLRTPFSHKVRRVVLVR